MKADEVLPVRGDVFKYLQNAGEKFDIVFADPPYDLPGFNEIPRKVIDSGVIAPGGVFIMEHPSTSDFSSITGAIDHRRYGSVNFTIFKIE